MTCKQRADTPLCRGRSVALFKVETMAFAKDMNEDPKTSKLTESRAFIRSFGKGTEVRQGDEPLQHIQVGGQSPSRELTARICTSQPCKGCHDDEDRLID